MIKCQSQHELFAWLSKLATGTGNFVFQTGELVRDYLGEEYMRVHFEEADSFKEVFNLREAVRTQFVRMEKALLDRKEKLYKAGDMSKWAGGGPSCFRDALEMSELRNQLMADRNLAYTYILPKESQELEFKREELCFLTN